MIKKIIDVFSVADGEFPDPYRPVFGFVMEPNVWTECFYLDGHWYYMADSSKLEYTIIFWTELCETFEPDITFIEN
jgi:hypothetical protein